MCNNSKRSVFNSDQLQAVKQAVTMAEELVSDYFKMSRNEWLRPKYDVETLVNLKHDEIVDEPFAQIVRYQGRRKGTTLGSGYYDFYKICLQDHTILKALEQSKELALMPFSLYIIAHELIHIVRFGKFLQNFDASQNEKLAEERRVHTLTHQVVAAIGVPGMEHVLAFYHNWR